MSWVSEPVQMGIVVAVAITIGYIWHLEGRGRWRRFLSERFIYGIPWGTAVAVVTVVGFYLFVQSGLHNWDSPVVHPFRSWSYTYPTGWLTAGFAHAGPNHLLGNMLGTLALAPIVEYAWGHYPPSKRKRGTDTGTRAGADYSYPPPGELPENPEPAIGPESEGWLARPWIRALVVFPAAIVVVSLLTSFFALGWSLGFSGTVFALLGFALITFPMTTVVAMVALTGMNVIVAALQNPVVEATTDPGVPGPPSWAGVNVQAHLLGFLIGVLLAVALVHYRNERPNVERVAFATILVVLARQLWMLSLGSDGVFRQYRGIGVIFVFCLSIVIIALVAVDDEPLVDRSIPLLPSLRTLSLLWVGAVGTIGGLVIFVSASSVGLAITVVVAAVLFTLPVLPSVLGSRIVPSPLTVRALLVGGLLVVVVIVALPSLATNFPSMDENPIPGEGELVVEDYAVTYEEDVPHGRTTSNDSGLIVVSEEREIWSSVVDRDRLAHTGEETVVLGGIGWRAEVTASRTGWQVDGNNTVYVVDLEHAGETVRSFESDPKQARSRIAGKRVTVFATDDAFRLNVTQNGDLVGETAIPEVNETTAVGDGRLTFSTRERNGVGVVFAEYDGTRVLIAQKETFN